LNNAEYSAALELHKIYRVIPDEQAAADGDLRSVDESGEDYLYPASYFLVIQFSGKIGATLEASFVSLR